jgi:hypothetical protein
MLKNTHKWYAMQIISEMYIKCGLVILKIDGLHLSKLVLVVASHKKTSFGTPKMENGFSAR